MAEISRRWSFSHFSLLSSHDFPMLPSQDIERFLNDPQFDYTSFWLNIPDRMLTQVKRLSYMDLHVLFDFPSMYHQSGRTWQRLGFGKELYWSISSQWVNITVIE